MRSLLSTYLKGYVAIQVIHCWWLWYVFSPFAYAADIQASAQISDGEIQVGQAIRLDIIVHGAARNVEVPDDVKKALSTSAKAQDLWEDITPLARWDWIRWVRAVKTDETRKKHLDVMLDKLNKGMRRPCCFNRNLCSEPAVSHNWALLDPTFS